MARQIFLSAESHYVRGGRPVKIFQVVKLGVGRLKQRELFYPPLVIQKFCVVARDDFGESDTKVQKISILFAPDEFVGNVRADNHVVDDKAAGEFSACGKFLGEQKSFFADKLREGDGRRR